MLINYGSSHSTNYGETNCFKPYVDPAAYEDPNQVVYFLLLSIKAFQRIFQKNMIIFFLIFSFKKF